MPAISWPANSPDLSPIENIWSLVHYDVCQVNPQTMPALKQAIKKSWLAHTKNKSLISKLLGGWGKRLDSVIASNGKSFDYRGQKKKVAPP
jgi:hypothetical protein